MYIGCPVRHDDMLYLLEYVGHAVGNRTRKATKADDAMALLTNEYMALAAQRGVISVSSSSSSSASSATTSAATSTCKKMKTELDTIATTEQTEMDVAVDNTNSSTPASSSAVATTPTADSNAAMVWSDVKSIAMKTLHLKYVPLLEVSPEFYTYIYNQIYTYIYILIYI